MQDTVVVKDLDSKFKYEVSERPGGEHIKVCYACGVCTAGCPITEIEEEYNPRAIVRKIMLGMKEEVLNSEYIWLCALCYTCHANCPQDVRFCNVIKALRSMAVEQGYAKPSFIKKMEEINVAFHKIRIKAIKKIVDKKNEDVKINVEELF
ncbi:MAG: 4Fe-4S dicluster domain-containing protein [bacterium]|nr:4Fe-4S dicluster domain-containing protein [bacterium]